MGDWPLRSLVEVGPVRIPSSWIGALVAVCVCAVGCETTPARPVKPSRVERPRPVRKPLRIGSSVRSSPRGGAAGKRDAPPDDNWEFAAAVEGVADLEDPPTSPEAERKAMQAALLEAMAFISRRVSEDDRPATATFPRGVALKLKWSDKSVRPEAVELVADDRGRMTRITSRKGRLTSPPLSSARLQRLLDRLSPRIKVLGIDTASQPGVCTVRLGLYQPAASADPAGNS